MDMPSEILLGMSSPPTRGCSAPGHCRDFPVQVLPADAGVFRSL
ncbi:MULTISPECIES: hypothetical protein [unclassified Streptomyces]